jgi:hypothetical protein
MPHTDQPVQVGIETLGMEKLDLSATDAARRPDYQFGNR